MNTRCKHLYTGAGDVTNSDPDNNTIITRFEGKGESCELNCTVKNDGTQTDTVWSIENYMGKRKLPVVPDDKFEISGDQRPLPELNYGNHLKIHNCSSKKLNGTILYCGSHENPQQRRFEIKVCGMLLNHYMY